MTYIAVVLHYFLLYWFATQIHSNPGKHPPKMCCSRKYPYLLHGRECREYGEFLELHNIRIGGSYFDWKKSENQKNHDMEKWSLIFGEIVDKWGLTMEIQLHWFSMHQSLPVVHLIHSQKRNSFLSNSACTCA